MSTIIIVRAQPSDAALLKQIAVAAKRYWGYPDHLINQWAASPIITPAAIDHDLVFAAHQQGQPIGWYRLIVDSSPAILEDLWVIPSWIGQGVGRMLFTHAVAQCRAQRIAQIELDADPHAVGFYRNMGCTVIGETISEWNRPVPRLRYTLAAVD
ncbi:GNAT family N-acetyltransferase [Chloroflexus sp.]|uniref:GNAT family N-acetyltransferase n=1 Tax=Chloroflexus sp. TaxID=1904827 RepID=UPI002ADDEF1B|nr:GNAT family N-acetyltransferase [Chloroflexus sp.]